jgi:alanyl-tRNA synthetase
LIASDTNKHEIIPMKTSKEIRNDFLEFFKSKGHTIVPSAPLLPIGDKTLLFTNAGMNQFKDVFLGQGKRDYSRACDTQKCMRVSGKHNDLDEVGHDGYHHTFFEMLGNWSFGDYYKKEAIAWAWELLTKVWALPKEKLYATVYNDDQEAHALWAGVTDIARDHILYFGEKDNFWEMGETGPCGPCSEVHIDRGPGSCDKAHIPGHVCGVNAGCARYIELWNLVFIQYNRQADGSLLPLPEKHVDTGMGFERVVTLLQGKKSNYESDVFMPILEAIAAKAGVRYEGGQVPESNLRDAAMQVIADHLRALAFSIADGIMPANDGRGYVLRRILRRGLRFGQKLGFEEPFMTSFLPALDASMGDAFPELRREMTRVREVIAHEEERYFATLHAGMRELNSLIAAAKAASQPLSGKDMFRLYDSLGFPVEIALEAAKDEGLQADQAGFDALMEEQKNRGRQSWKGAAGGEFDALPLDDETSEYTGDTVSTDNSNILFLVKDRALADELRAGEEGYLAAARTPFYAEGGGQEEIGRAHV